MNEIARVSTRRAAPMAPVLQPSSFSELVQFAQMAAKTSMVPAAFKGKPEDIMITVQFGSELGLSPMQSLQSVACINGKPALWGDALIGLCRQSAVCENITEKMEGEGDGMVAICIAKRRGMDAVTSRFSVADAKKANLWGKQGPWSQYPARMLQQRARGFALRDAFADVLKGLKTVEELRDYPEREATPYTAGPTIEAKADPVPRQTTAQAIDDEIPDFDAEAAKPQPPTFDDLVEGFIYDVAVLQTKEEFDAIQSKAQNFFKTLEAEGHDALKDKAVQALADARPRFYAADPQAA